MFFQLIHKMLKIWTTCYNFKVPISSEIPKLNIIEWSIVSHYSGLSNLAEIDLRLNIILLANLLVMYYL